MNYIEVSELFVKLAHLSVTLKDEITTKHYLRAHKKVFGAEHPNTKAILNNMIQTQT